MTKRLSDNIRLLCVLSVVLLCVSAHGKEWHVCQKILPGIDTNSQVHSIGEAVERLQAGDTVTITLEGNIPKISRELVQGRTVTWRGRRTHLTLDGEDVAVIEID